MSPPWERVVIWASVRQVVCHLLWGHVSSLASVNVVRDTERAWAHRQRFWPTLGTVVESKSGPRLIGRPGLNSGAARRISRLSRRSTHLSEALSVVRSPRSARQNWRCIECSAKGKSSRRFLTPYISTPVRLLPGPFCIQTTHRACSSKGGHQWRTSSTTTPMGTGSDHTPVVGAGR